MMQALFVRCRRLGVFVILGWAMGAGAPAVRADEQAPGKFMERLFQRLDSNGDGVVTADEIQAFEHRLFARLDANHDGVLTAEEFAARRTGKQDAADVPQKSAAARGRRFAAMDTDGDGRVTADEFAAAFNKRLSALDANGDGRITLDELKSARSPI